jgi:hypothetical protein
VHYPICDRSRFQIPQSPHPVILDH